MKFIIILIIFCGCYTQKKATQQFSKAAITFPKIPADYCAFYYPVKDSIVKGDSVFIIDTITNEIIATDTLYNKDTVTIIKTLPSKVITKVIHLTDTIYRENTAQLKLCDIERGNLIGQLNAQTSKTDTAQSKATKRGRIMWGLIGLIALVIGYNVYRRLKPLA